MPIFAYTCVRIVDAVGGSQKYIFMQMSANADKCQSKGAGGGGVFMVSWYHRDWLYDQLHHQTTGTFFFPR